MKINKKKTFKFMFIKNIRHLLKKSMYYLSNKILQENLFSDINFNTKYKKNVVVLALNV